MTKQKHILLLLMLALVVLNAPASETTRYKPLEFVNPGNRRLLQSDAGNFYFYRSLPEKSMSLTVNGMESLQIRTVSTEQVRKPRVIVIVNRQRTTYDLKQSAKSGKLYVYEPIDIAITGRPEKIEILCYDSQFYFRVFERIVPKSRPQRLPNLQVLEHGGIMLLSHNSHSSEYYSFEPGQTLRFNVNNKRTAVLYVRARLTDRSIPVFDLYRNNELVERVELSTARTGKYNVAGITHLTIGRKIELPEQDGSAQYTLRPVSEHLFIARPVILRD